MSMNDNPDAAGDWPIHALTDEKLREQQASIKRAMEWQKQEAEAAYKASLYLTQAANNEVPHD
jgi:hypothetical protein